MTTTYPSEWKLQWSNRTEQPRSGSTDIVSWLRSTPWVHARETPTHGGRNRPSVLPFTFFPSLFRTRIKSERVSENKTETERRNRETEKQESTPVSLYRDGTIKQGRIRGSLRAIILDPVVVGVLSVKGISRRHVLAWLCKGACTHTRARA